MLNTKLGKSKMQLTGINLRFPCNPMDYDNNTLLSSFLFVYFYAGSAHVYNDVLPCFEYLGTPHVIPTTKPVYTMVR